ncbi:GNAT family N-acetyltransferase [Myceligenerans salitolerans]|uniref:N-acetyltransferase n=1 Tax=Myceligenerans salitolerans TaxID=1230528 RepID=A0ABS3IAQ6_9MICO|nr:GNAT family N-acetyltransferase [Myceligenerans salitolerans]MBO0609523.1 N-acetyltransferase [Myceligenerans salitolerans]
MSDNLTVTVTDNPAESRFEARLPDGTLTGQAVYERDGRTVVFTHTEVLPEYEGKGIASRLAQEALGLVRGGDDRIVPLCPFIRRYVKKHSPEYDDLLLDVPPAS